MVIWYQKPVSVNVRVVQNSKNGKAKMQTKQQQNITNVLATDITFPVDIIEGGYFKSLSL